MKELKSFIVQENTNHHLLPFAAITESWLKRSITDAQVHIPHYEVSRSDRNKRTGGGVLLYSHEAIPLTECLPYDDETCQALFCRFDSIKVCIAVIYRPPDAPDSSFAGVIKFLDKCIKDVDDDRYQFNLLGDFNFPDIDWQSLVAFPGNSRSFHY